MALANRGEYRVCKEYSRFVDSESEWWKLKPSQRKKKNLNFFQHSMCREHAVPASVTASASCSLEPPATIPSGLSASTGITTLSQDHLSQIWVKATNILRDPGNIVLAPGSKTTHFVASISQKDPHKVVVHPGGKYVCDCLGYRSAKLCAHALAVAESCGLLFDYLSWYKQLKCKPSVGYLANLSKPKMCGNVPSSPKPSADSQYLGTASHTSVQRGQSNYHPTSQYTPVRGGNLSYPPQLGPPYSPLVYTPHLIFSH